MAGNMKTVDVFCGMGALSLGFERAGFRSILGMDMEEYAAKTYAANRTSTPVLLGDCTKFDPAALRKIVGDADAVIGGVPCEPFSRARPDYGKETQTGDARRSLVNYALRLVEEFQPRVFAFENVWGAVDSAAWKKAKAKARKMGYAVDVWKLDSSDYGTPQARKRAFFVGARTKAELSPPPPMKKKRTAAQAVADLGEPGGKDPLHSEAHKVTPMVREALRSAKPGDKLKGHGKYRRYGDLVMNPDRPAPTITVQGRFFHWNKKRYLTPRELARLQEIPDSYKFDCSPSKAGYLVGDAVPVGLAAAVASRLAGHVSKSAPTDAAIEPGALAALEDVLKVGYPPEEVEQQICEDCGVEYGSARPAQKQEDPYMEIPDEDKAPYPYTVHHHFRGKSLHADLRIGFRPRRLLIGWTLNTQIKDALKEPVTTLAEAKAVAKNRMNDVSKIDWSTGDWARRPKAGTPKLVRTEILSERKTPQPWEWINVEGKTREPAEEGAPPVGGTRQFPGVFHIVDKGDIEFGAQKPWFHEYFVRGRGMKYRLILRQLKLPAQKYRHARDKCMGCRKAAPTVDVIWAEGMARAWFCDKCLVKWKQEDGCHAVDYEKKVTTGEVPENWTDVHKEFGPDDVVESKAILPPSEAQEGKPGRGKWLAIQPDDPTPYVLGNEAIKKGWMPPQGVSALPKAVRKQVPAEHRYWKKKGVAAKQARDALAEAVKKGDVKLNYEAAYKAREEKASLLDADFVLQKQTWSGPVQVRVGPSKTLWWLRLNVGKPRLLALEMYGNPLDNPKLAAVVGTDPHKDSMEFAGDVKPGHYLNPSKGTPSNIEIMDSGKASVLAHSQDSLKIDLKGEKLKGVFQATRSPGAEEWMWSSAQAETATEKADTDGEEIQLHIPIMKAEKEKRQVTGIVLEPDTVDAQGDTINEETIERAAHKFLAKYNNETKMGLLHQKFSAIGVELVECWIAREATTMGGQKVKKGSWMMTVHVTSDKTWQDVKSGKITGFSIGGTATVI